MKKIVLLFMLFVMFLAAIGQENSNKAYLIDYPEVTKTGIIIKYEKEILEKTEVEFYNDFITITSASITVIEEGIAKVDVYLIGGKYNLKSNNINFGKYNVIEINEYDVDIRINYDKDISDYILKGEQPIIKNFLIIESDSEYYYVDIEFDTIPDYILCKGIDEEEFGYATFNQNGNKTRIYVMGRNTVEILPMKKN